MALGHAHAHLAAERLILDAVERRAGCSLERGRSLELPGGARVEVDGVSGDAAVLVEVFAHQGALKGGQLHKIASDALELLTVASGRDPKPRLILAFADEQLATWAAGRSWLAAALTIGQIEVVVVDLGDAVRAELRDEKARLFMVAYRRTSPRAEGFARRSGRRLSGGWAGSMEATRFAAFCFLSSRSAWPGGM